MSKFQEGEYPRSISAESSLLASIILHPENYYQVSDTITADDFFLEKHKKIYSAIEKLVNEGKPIDMVAIADIIAPSISYEEFYSVLENIPDIIHIEEYARIVKEKSILRKLMETSSNVMAECLKQEKDTTEILENVDKKIYEIFIGAAKSDFVPISEIAEKNLKYLEEISKEKHFITGISTGFDRLDELTSGFQPSEFIIIAGRPSTGKTSFALSLSLEMGLKRRKVGFISLEMSKEQIGLRLLCAHANVELNKVRSGYLSAEDFRFLAESTQELEKANIYIDDSSPYYIHELRAKCRRLMKTQGLDILFIDYIQLLKTKERYENRNLQLGAISAHLKSIAKEFKIPVVALSQLSRNPERRREKDIRPTMADLRESGNLEQDADLVILLYRNKEMDENNMAEIIIDKQRNGPTGSFKLVFLKKFALFKEPSGEGY
jgi:replicative DNA helicase